jgi:preprotein translocase SecE subunit
MALGIYKSSQGYWVRVMTAAFFGVLLLFTAGWAWNEAEAVSLPPRQWDLSLTNTSRADIAIGDTVTIERINDEGVSQAIGTATVTDFERFTSRGRSALSITDMTVSGEGENFGNADLVRATAMGGTGGSPDAGFSARVSSRTSIPVFPQLYLQGAAAGVVLLLGAGLIYVFCGVKANTCEFLIATDGEMKKVNWTTRKEIIGSTQVVIFATFLIAAALFGIDTVFSSFFSLIGVLEGV